MTLFKTVERIWLLFWG